MAIINTIQIVDAEGLEDLEKYDLYLKTLLVTEEGTVPGNREFGMDMGYLSEPPDIAVNLFVADLQEKIEAFLPEIELSYIQWIAETDGTLTPKLSIKRKEDMD